MPFIIVINNNVYNKKKLEKMKGLLGKCIYLLVGMLLVVMQSCKKLDEGPAPQSSGGAYLRFAVLQNVPLGSNGLRFYFDGKLNVNGDSITKSPNGSVFFQATRTYNIIQYSYNNQPALYGEDYTGPKLAGVYAYSSTGNYFPNTSHRVPLAPNIGDYNYYKWADVATGIHQFTIKPVYNRILNSKPVEIIGNTLINDSIVFEKGLLHTVTAVQTNIENPNFDLVILKDHPDSIKLKDSVAFVRFVNITPNYFDQNLNGNTNSVDLYLVRARYGVEEPERLIQADTKRFQSSLNLPFTELNLSAEMNDTIPFGKGYGTVVGSNFFELNRTSFTIRIYRKGESAANLKTIIADFRLDDFIPLLVRDPNNRYQATRNTVYFSIDETTRPTGIVHNIYCSFLAFERKDAASGYFLR